MDLKPEILVSLERKRLEQIEGIIFDIQRYSVHDGPGLRTNVFFKGCPLRCGWCSNPESQQKRPEFMFFAHNCINCGQFSEACPVWLRRNNGSGWVQEPKEEFSARTAVCPTEAIHWIGERMTAGDVINNVLRDVPFYENGGGMTLTGGESTMQPYMAEALLRLAKIENISTAMETCGHAPWETFERLLPYLDHLLFDLKHVNSEIHRTYTGVGNERILDNLRRVVRCETPVAVRVPLIPGFNASEESLREIAEFVAALDGAVQSVDILPYHTFGRTKYTALGREYPWHAYHRLSDDEVGELANIVKSYGLTVTIGG